MKKQNFRTIIGLFKHYSWVRNECKNELEVWYGNKQLLGTVSDCPKTDKECQKLFMELLNDWAYITYE